MAFQFEPRDEGFLVYDATGRAVASLETKESGYEEYIDRGTVQTRLKLTPLPRGEWRLHFTGRKWVGQEELKALLAEVAALPEK